MSFLDHEGLRRFFLGRRRFQLAWIFVILVFLTAHHYPSLLGISVCFFGASLRFLASGFLKKETTLAVGGPYAYTRNPLYLGTFLMALGTSLSVGAYFLTGLMGAIFFLNYHYVIEYEEARLPFVFSDRYELYCRLVPRFWPRLSRPPIGDLLEINSDPGAFLFSPELARENRAFEAYATFFGMIVGSALLFFVKTKLFSA